MYNPHPRKNIMQHTMGHKVRRMRRLKPDATRSHPARLAARYRAAERALKARNVAPVGVV